MAFTVRDGGHPKTTPASTLELYRDFNYIGVRSFILPGAPFADKTANPGGRGLRLTQPAVQEHLTKNRKLFCEALHADCRAMMAVDSDD